MTQIAAKIAEYFGVDPDTADPQPVITGIYRPRYGWTALNATAEVATVDAVRRQRAKGAVSIEVAFGDRVADFTPSEVIGYAERPLLGGRLA